MAQRYVYTRSAAIKHLRRMIDKTRENGLKYPDTAEAGEITCEAYAYAIELLEEEI